MSSWEFRGAPEASWELLGAPETSCELLELLGGPGSSWEFLGLLGCLWWVLRGSSGCHLGSSEMSGESCAVSGASWGKP